MLCRWFSIGHVPCYVLKKENIPFAEDFLFSYLFWKQIYFKQLNLWHIIWDPFHKEEEFH